VVNLCPYMIVDSSSCELSQDDREFVDPVSAVCVYALSSKPPWLRKNPC
jgi:hypothetical protein